MDSLNKVQAKTAYGRIKKIKSVSENKAAGLNYKGNQPSLLSNAPSATPGRDKWSK